MTSVLRRSSVLVPASRVATAMGTGRARAPFFDVNGRCLQGGDGARFVCLQRFSRVERVTGIEPALSAWERFELMGFVLGSLRVSRSRAAWSVPGMPAVMAR